MNCSIAHFPILSQNNKAKRNNFCWEGRVEGSQIDKYEDWKGHMEP